MATTLYIHGKEGIGDDVTHVLNDISEKIKAEHLTEATPHLLWIDLPDTDDHSNHHLAVSLSDRIQTCCVRLRHLVEGKNVETLGLYHAGQRLAQRTVAWPTNHHESARVISTQSEHRFTLLLITDVPEQLDNTITDNTVQYAITPDEPSGLPIIMSIPNADTSWAHLPGFHPIFSKMVTPVAKLHKPGNVNLTMPFPEPQSVIVIEAILQPVSTVFELECVCYGLPVGSIVKAFDDWMGCRGKAYVLPFNESKLTGYDTARYFIATLGMTLPEGMTNVQAANNLYGLSDKIEVALEWPVEVDDPYGWADLAPSQIVSAASGVEGSDERVIISRRVMMNHVQTEQSLIDRIQPALDKLPVGVYMELAFPGRHVAWYRRFGSGS